MPLYVGVPYYDPLLTAIFFFANNQSWHSARPCTWNSTWMNLSQPHCSPASPDDVSSIAAHQSAAIHHLCKHPCPTRELQSWKKCNGTCHVTASQFMYFCYKTTFISSLTCQTQPNSICRSNNNYDKDNTNRKNEFKMCKYSSFHELVTRHSSPWG